MGYLETGFAQRIKDAANANLQRTFRQEAELLNLRLHGTFLADLVPTVVSDVLRKRDEKAAQPLPILGFNGQRVRALILLHMMRSLRFDTFVETGTFSGDTCLLVAAQTDLLIRSCDLSHRSQPFAKVLSELLFERFKLRLMDSRRFLRLFFEEEMPSRPFFYLDAHWEVDIPLLEELQIILTSAREFAVVIDDFRVPGDPGFGFDVYEGAIFEWDYISPVLENHRDQLSVFYPAYSSKLETGAKRGFVMIVSNSLVPAITSDITAELIILQHRI